MLDDRRGPEVSFFKRMACCSGDFSCWVWIFGICFVDDFLSSALYAGVSKSGFCSLEFTDVRKKNDNKKGGSRMPH